MRESTWKILLLGAVLFAGCDGSDSSNGVPAKPNADAPPAGQQAGGPPVVQVDAEHQIRDEKSRSKPYLLAGGQGIVLDATNFTMRDPENMARLPNSVQVLYGTGVYCAPWPAKGSQRTTIDMSSLRTIKGPAFSGFQAGQHAFIAIGYYQPPGKPGESTNAPAKPDFVPFWAGALFFH
jgi:hypothetical protein